MTIVLIGNAAPLMADGRPAEIGNTITVVEMREGWNDQQEVELALSTPNDPILNMISLALKGDAVPYAIGVLEVFDLWNGRHSNDPPEWIESDDDGFANAISKIFGCDVGRPAGWNATLSPTVIAGLDAMTPVGEPPAGGVDPLPPPMAGGSIDWDRFNEINGIDPDTGWREHRLLVNAGRDALHSQHLNTAAQPAAFNYMAVSESAVAPSAASTTLPGEITTAGGGLLRAQATYAHTGGTNTTTLTKTFTANGSDVLPKVIAKIGVLNVAVTGGTLGYETLLNATATLTISGDNVAITHTITAG